MTTRKLEPLTLYERETIITFNEEETDAIIFTYNNAWQQHFEKKLGIQPVRKDAYGAREYRINKKRLKPPRAPVKLSAEAKKRIGDRGRKQLEKLRKKRGVLPKSPAESRSAKPAIPSGKGKGIKKTASNKTS